MTQEWEASHVQGEAFAASVINAVIDGPGWDKTVLLWTYDEHGGYYDHVPPPAAIRPDSIPPPKLAEPLQDSDPASLACSTSGPGTIPPPGSVTGP